MRSIRNATIDQDKVYEVARIVLSNVSKGINHETPLLAICNNVVKDCCRELDLDYSSYADGERIAAGIRMVDYLNGYVAPEVREAVRNDGTVDYMTMLLSTTPEMDDEVAKAEEQKFEVDPTRGPYVWSGFKMDISDIETIDFVKKARRFGLHNNYSYHSIPEVYEAINRLQRTGFRIFKDVLKIAEDGFIFNPTPVEDNVKTKAIQAIAVMKKRARASNSLQRLEESDWYADQYSVISEWSKHFEFNEVIKRANKWDEDVLHFVYTLDSRSRMYAMTPYLNPQGSDFAKALLVFAESQPLDLQTFAVVTANHAGRDKLSFEDRVKWTEDNIEDIINIGLDPHGHVDKLIEWDVVSETKSRWQFLACCIEWANYWKAGTPSDYETNLVCALDATCSALQIATVISRDEEMAKHVNLVKQDKPGDIYGVSGEDLRQRLSKLEEDEITEGIQSVINHPSIRKVAKRPQMVADYSGTMKGMMDMTYSDRFSTKIPDVTKKDANLIGKVLYQVTNDPSRGSTKIKEFLRAGVQYHQGGAMMTWMTRDGFTCFQSADMSKEGAAEGTISGINVKLKYYSFQDKPNKQKHQNLLCPNITHSIDATIVRCISRAMPTDSPLAMVHDSYGTSSNTAYNLLPIVIEAFLWIGDRDWYERMIADMVGHHRPLPSAGKLTDEQIMEANYAIC